MVILARPNEKNAAIYTILTDRGLPTVQLERAKKEALKGGAGERRGP